MDSHFFKYHFSTILSSAQGNRRISVESNNFFAEN